MAVAQRKGGEGPPPHLPILQTPNLLHVLCTTQPNQEPEGKIGLPGCRGGWERMALGSGGANNVSILQGAVWGEQGCKMGTPRTGVG